MNTAIIQQQSTNIALNELSNKFLTHISHTKSISTYKSYFNKLNTFVEWFRACEVVGNTRTVLEAYRGYINMKLGTAKSKNLYLSVVRNLYKYLFDEGYITDLPTSKLKNFTVNNTYSKVALNEYQIYDLKQYIDNSTHKHHKRDRALIYLAMSNGLRVNELCNIEIEDFSYIDDKRVLYLLRKGYTDKSNYIFLAPKVFNMLMEFKGDRTEGYLFTSRDNGGKLCSESMSRIIKDIFVKCGIRDKNITPHSLRHTTAVTAIKSGATVEQVMTMLNHKNLNTTQIYINSLNRAENPAELKINFL